MILYIPLSMLLINERWKDLNNRCHLLVVKMENKSEQPDNRSLWTRELSLETLCDGIRMCGRGVYNGYTSLRDRLSTAKGIITAAAIVGLATAGSWKYYDMMTTALPRPVTLDVAYVGNDAYSYCLPQTPKHPDEALFDGDEGSTREWSVEHHTFYVDTQPARRSLESIGYSPDSIGISGIHITYISTLAVNNSPFVVAVSSASRHCQGAYHDDARIPLFLPERTPESPTEYFYNPYPLPDANKTPSGKYTNEFTFPSPLTERFVQVDIVGGSGFATLNDIEFEYQSNPNLVPTPDKK